MFLLSIRRLPRFLWLPPATAGTLLLLAACKPITAQPTLSLHQVTDTANAPAPPQRDPSFPSTDPPIAVAATQPPTPIPVPTLPEPTPIPERIDGPVTVAVAPAVPDDWSAALLRVLNATNSVQTADGERPLRLLDQVDNAAVKIQLVPATRAANPLANHVLAVVAPFATVRDDITAAELLQRWRAPVDGPILVSQDAAPWAEALMGIRAAQNETVATKDLLARLEATPDALGIISFDEIDPSFKVFTVDGVNVLSNRFRPETYPLAVTLSVEGLGASAVRPLLANVIEPSTNRDASRLTQLIMTGVTAMSRVTALKMDQKGADYPALVISDVLSAADITHISNEVPFLDDCVADPSENNLTLCSSTKYWAALADVGTDIVGLSGNHVNDFGRDGARRSIQWYRDHNIPIYGGGMNLDEACAPLLWEDHGNRFAFIATLAYEPANAWATADQPGACYFYDNKDRILDLVRQLAKKVDVVAIELQYLEIYDPTPTPQQVAEFRDLRDAGATIVSGVQSHVPQAQEPYGAHDAGGAGMITYGLGNFFFDQMWSWPTRTELAARHTIYNGKLLNTELLTMVLEDYAQPRWATPAERADILNRIFAAAPARPVAAAAP